MTSDQITLTLPREREFFGVAHLVLGGLAARLDLSVDQLEDLRVAIDELLGHQDGDHDVTVTVRVTDDAIETVVGPFGDSLERAFADSGRGVGLRRVLETVMDAVEVTDRSGERWVSLTKAVA